jgi:hypothetical protein
MKSGLPRGSRVGSIVTASLITLVALAALALWILPAVLTRHPSDGVEAAERLKAINDARAPLVAFLVAVIAAGTLLVTIRTYILNSKVHATDSYTKAVGQLAHESSAVRIGGLYALVRIGNDSRTHSDAAIEVLGAFIRERSNKPREDPHQVPEDVDAGLHAAEGLLGISDAMLNLRGAHLDFADLSRLPRSRLDLKGADVVDVVF